MLLLFAEEVTCDGKKAKRDASAGRASLGRSSQIRTERSSRAPGPLTVRG